MGGGDLRHTGAGNRAAQSRRAAGAARICDSERHSEWEAAPGAVFARGEAPCVAIEDAPAGIRAARAAGTRVIAVRTTTEAAELRESGADWILADLSRVSAHPNGGCLALTFTEE